MKCNTCKEIVAHHKLLARKYPQYHCNPVDGSGDLDSKIILIGLAPGLHGANKTGVPFTSDYSGEIIRKLLSKLKLDDIFITNAVKCYPKNNKPSVIAINNCKVHTKRELDSLSNLRVIITLGAIAYYQILKLYNIERKYNKFEHGNTINLNTNISLIASYHCSKLNFNTHRIDLMMLEKIFNKAKKTASHE
jgi:uracil-DNA glycosylase family 4